MNFTRGFFGVWIIAIFFGLAITAFAVTNEIILVELQVKTVGVNEEAESPIVILTDKKEKRFLPIWIGFGEAQAIVMELQQIKPSRPMTHDLIRNLLQELDGRVEKLVISEIKQGTYVGSLSIISRGRTRNMDCRPSDGIAIALRVNAPILAAEKVMKHSLPVPVGNAEGKWEAENLSALGLGVQTLTPELAGAFDLGKTKGVLVSASQQVDVQVGDVILAVGATSVENIEQLKAAIAKAGRKAIELKLLREGKTLTIRVRAGKTESL